MERNQDNHRDDQLDHIEGITHIRPLRRGRRLLAVSKPPKPVGELSDSEIEGWAGRVVDGMAEQVRSASAR